MEVSSGTIYTASVIWICSCSKHNVQNICSLSRQWVQVQCLLERVEQKSQHSAVPLIPRLHRSVWLNKIIVKTTEDNVVVMEAEILFFCSAVRIPVQEWDLRSPPLVCILAWDGLFLLWKIIVYQGYCQNGCNWSRAKFLLVLSTDGNEGERTHPDTISVNQLGSIMMVQWHCLKLPQNTTCVFWGNSLWAPFFILLESGASVWNRKLSRIKLYPCLNWWAR